MCGLRYVSPHTHLEPDGLCTGQRRRPRRLQRHGHRVSTTSLLTGQGHVVRREKGRQAQTSLGRINGSTSPREAARIPDRPVCGVALECTHAGKPLVDGMLQERVGPAALFCLPAASTPCMGGLLCAPSGEVGRRGNFCLLFVFLSSSGGEEAARQYTAIAMILKSRAHTATRKLRRRGCYGSTSFTKLHDAQTTVHT